MRITETIQRRAGAVVLALALAVPGALLIGQAAAAVAFGTTGVHVAWRAEAVNLSEAVYARDVAEAARLIEEGANVNAALPVRRGWLADDDVALTPIEAAVAGDRTNAFDLLLSRGARLEPATLPRLICIARRAEADEVLARLRAMSEGPLNCRDVALPW
jgi:hypothetical protein